MECLKMNHDIEIAARLYNDIYDKNTSNVKNLLNSGNIDLNLVIPDKGMSILHLAVGIDPVSYAQEMTKMILYYGGNPNQNADEGVTPLHVAAAWGRPDILKMLLDNGGNPYLKDDEYKTPLDYAMDNDHSSIIECLLEYFQIDKDKCFDPPDMYSLTLDKVIIDNGYFEGEYSIQQFDIDDNDFTSISEVESLRKSFYVKEWCSNNLKDNFLKESQDLIRNKNGDIMFKRPLSYNKYDVKNNDSKILQFKFDSSKNSSMYHSCREMNSSSKINKQSISSDSIKNATESINNIDSDITSSDDESSLSGIQTLKFTRNEDNNIYSILHKQTQISELCADEGFDSEKSQSRYSNIVLTNSPVPLPHKNYSTKSSIHSKKDQVEGKVDLISILDTFNLENDNIKCHSEELNVQINDKERIERLKSNIQNNITQLEDNDEIKPENKAFIELSIEEENNEKLKSYLKNESISNSLSKSCSIRSLAADINETIASVIEEYKYEDKEAGVVLIEKRILVTPIPIINDGCDKSIAQSNVSSVSSLPISLDYDTDGLREELTCRGLIPGPITSTTKKVYLKKLSKLKKNNENVIPTSNLKKKLYSVELEKTLRDSNWYSDLSFHAALEQKILKQFETPDPKIRWREGVIKSSFTYLLLDPRITDNLPGKDGVLSKSDLWKLFIDSIFYIGKGKRSRPYNHLYQAVALYNNGQLVSQDKKVQNILDIWKDGLGVVCLHIFQNVIPAEAYTREAAMIDVIGLKNLKNIKPGNYYGIASSWSLKEKKLLGLYLLYRAMLIFLNEGERQLRPADIC